MRSKRWPRKLPCGSFAVLRQIRRTRVLGLGRMVWIRYGAACYQRFQKLRGGDYVNPIPRAGRRRTSRSCRWLRTGELASGAARLGGLEKEEAVRGCVELLLCRFVDFYFGQSADTMALQAAVQRGVTRSGAAWGSCSAKHPGSSKRMMGAATACAHKTQR